ncbi:hypothetical protein [Nocardia sp. NBC_01329]|uniref:hypothetical protein n=1 Tax=Nocardia sp. NBC_01329 TaxID=2903594 RepID=UPI002E155011|nr:hypothetical protein OG405_00560 [Nocardia sp. NBC_01329]
MDREPREPDMGDDEQEDEVRAYERYIEDPPSDLRIRNREGDDDGRLGIAEELRLEPDRRDRAAAADDDRPAEAAAIHIENEPDS